ncbi:MAG: hypothetical protein FJZ58_07890 [Chlamydiae bacterium]|nr:hypothetical protein [Chlamydiota bacterium]
MTARVLMTTVPFFAQGNQWHGIVGVESGVIILSNAGRPRFFPTTDSVSEEFYRYSPHNQTKTVALYGGFLGAEWKDFLRFNPFSGDSFF